ncbi:hypothetical protein ACLESD_10585 [Pyxidicoccus sp. 3LFB2]
MPSPSSTTSDAPLGTFEEQVLLAVVRTGRAPDGGGAYGMAVRRELEEVAGREVAIGAVYATLDRLEAKALVASGRGEGAPGGCSPSRPGARGRWWTRARCGSDCGAGWTSCRCSRAGAPEGALSTG